MRKRRKEKEKGEKKNETSAEWPMSMDNFQDWYEDFWDDHKDRIIVAIIVVAVISVIVWFADLKEEEEVAIHEQTLCPIDDSHTQDYALVLLDGSDDIVGEYASLLYKEIENIASALPHYGKISLHDVATGKKRLLLKCAPESPDNLDADNVNVDWAKNDYEKNYLLKIRNAVQAFLDDKSRDQNKSPLLHSIAEVVALSDFQKTGNRSFYMFSDMLEHFGSNTHYRDLPPDEFEQWRQKDWHQKYQSKLDGVDVHIFYLTRSRSKHRQSENHKLFWNNYFKDAGAKIIKLTDVNLSDK